jgi:hypothetical protein
MDRPVVMISSKVESGQDPIDLGVGVSPPATLKEGVAVAVAPSARAQQRCGRPRDGRGRELPASLGPPRASWLCRRP